MKCLRIPLAFVIGIVLFSHPAAAVTNSVASSLAAGVGVAYDSTSNTLYYLEWNGGTLKRVRLTPACYVNVPLNAVSNCPIEVVASGFTHPQDVALDLANNAAYVTTRDDAGTTGVLWRVDVLAKTRTIVASNFGAPQQMALDVAGDTAYVVGFDSGQLWKIRLSSGAKTLMMSGLANPIGLAITADRTRAYVTEGGAGRLALIDLLSGTRVSNVLTGLTSPFNLAWTDSAENSLFLVQRDPANNVLRVDLPTASSAMAIKGLPWRPSAIAVDSAGGNAFITTDANLVQVPLRQLAVGTPAVFLAVGNVPSTSIVDGYASTPPDYFFQVKDSPFGGTLNIFGNLSMFRDVGATHYKVNVSYNGGPPIPVMATWNAAKWNPQSSRFESEPVRPMADGFYPIPAEYPGTPQNWIPSFLMIRWPSGANGLYTFSVEILLSSMKPDDLTWKLDKTLNRLTVRIDNDAPIVKLVAIHHDGSVLKPCAIVDTPPADYGVQFTAYDPNGHLLSYGVRALWGANSSSEVVKRRTYAMHVNADGPHRWKGVSDEMQKGWIPACNCAHTLWVDAWKRTIDGYGYLRHVTAHQSFTVNNMPNACFP